VGFDQVAEFTHCFENLILKLKEGQVPANSAVVTLLLACNDHVRQMIEGLKQDLSSRFDSAALLAEFTSALNGGLNVEVEIPTEPPPVPAEVLAQFDQVESHESPPISEI
jgi:two-component system chemotaxis sensor kinase CheA